MVDDKDLLSFIVIDMDDTMVMTSYANSLAYIRAIAQVLGVNLMPLYDRCSRITHEMLHEIFLSIPPQEYKKIQELKEDLYPQYLQYTHINTQVVEILKEYQHLTPILLTNSSERRMKETIGYHKLECMFTQMYCKPNYSLNKYAYLINTIGLDPLSCLIVDDDAKQLQMARSMGIPIEQHRHILPY